MGSSAHPYLARQLSTEYARQSTEGYPAMVDFGGDARNQEPDGDTRRRDSDLDRFGPSDRRNTLHPVSLVYCIDDVYRLTPMI